MSSPQVTRRDLFRQFTDRADPVRYSAGTARSVSPLSLRAQGRVPTERTSARFPDCVVRNQRGESFRLVSDLLSDRRVILGFIYTRCRGICPVTTDHMAAANRLLQERGVGPFTMLSLSVDPRQDGPADLARYAEINEAVGFANWQFIVASEADTLAIRRAFKLVDADPTRDADVTNHSGLLVLGNDRTDRWGAIPAGAEPIHIANTFERLTRDVSLQELAGFGRT